MPAWTLPPTFSAFRMTRQSLAIIKALTTLACLIPAILLIARIVGIGSLGPNPVQELLHTLGKTGLNLLLISLAVTPMRILTGQNWLVALRRTLGLATFGYVLVHAVTYVVLDQGMAWSALFFDVTQRPYITVGVLALVLLVPLAVTSTNKMQRRLGKRWLKLHRTVYLIGALAVVHYFWQVKITTVEPLIYTAILVLLLGFRLERWLSRRRRSQALSTP
jgi:methionine sulfoxide reductase heme-binding subunit